MAKVYNEQCVDYLQKKGKFDDAIEECSQAIKMDPNFADAYSNRGVARSQRGDIDGAIADYDKAIALDPQGASMAYANRGSARDD